MNRHQRRNKSLEKGKPVIFFNQKWLVISEWHIDKDRKDAAIAFAKKLNYSEDKVDENV